MKEFILILSVVMNGGSEMGGGAVIVFEAPFYSREECRAAAAEFTKADGSWSNHRAVCIERTTARVDGR